MAASPASSRRSAASSSASLKRSDDHQANPLSISVDTLVNHLLVAKRSLSSVNLVLQANELATSAHQVHEDTLLLAAHAAFLRNSIVDQIAVLLRVRKCLASTDAWGKKDFGRLVKAMDEAEAHLAATMSMLRGTDVHDVLRPAGEERTNLLDFVDETSVHGMREAMKKSIQDLQVRLLILPAPTNVVGYPAVV